MPKATAKTKHIAELIELLLTEPINPDNVKGNPVLPMDLKEPIGFAEKFSSLLYETPNIGSTSKKEFFIHGVLGSVLTLPDSGLMEKLGINKVYVKHTMRTEQGSDGKVEVVSDVVKLCFSFEKDGKKQIALRVFANDEVTGDGNPGDKYRYSDDELKEIAKKLDISNIDNINVDEHVFRISTEGDSDNKSFRLHKEQTGEVKEKFKAAASSQSQINNEFKEVSAQSTNLEDSFKKLSDEDIEKVIGGTGKIFDRFGKVYQDNQKKLSLFNLEAAYHGFHYGALALNFKYRYGLNCYVERTAGSGRADLIFMSRTKDANDRMNPKPIPVVIEFKGEGHTADEAIAQIKNKGYLYNLSIRTKAEDAVIAGVAKGGGLKVEKGDIFQSRGFIHQILEGTRRFNQNRIGRIKNILKGELKNLYHSIQSHDQHYLSKLVLGQILATELSNKYIFHYKDSGIGKEVTTFALDQGGLPVILNIIEHTGREPEFDSLGRTRGSEKQDDVFDSNRVPLIYGNKDAIKIDITTNSEADRFESGEDKKGSYFQGIGINRISSSKDESKSENEYAGKIEGIGTVGVSNLIEKLQNNADIHDDTKVTEALFPLMKALSPFKGLIEKEVDFQAIMQGLFINGKTKGDKEIRVYTESNLSPQGRMDLGLSFTQLSENDGSLIEDDPIILELKYTKNKGDVKNKLEEAKGQIDKKYKILRSFTDKKTAKHLAMVINNAAKNENDLIAASMMTVEVYHTSLSSGSDLSPGKKREASCLPGPSSKRPRLNKRAVDRCLLDMDENRKVDEEKTGIEVNEENFGESKIDNEKLRAYQEKIKDEGNEINDQLNKLIIEIQQAQAIKRFSDTYKVIIEKLFPALENIDGMQSENRSYFEQMCKLNLLRIISPIIKDVDFKSLLFNNPEKLVKDQSLLENVFASVESLVSDKYKQQQLQYEDFENLEDQINEEILNKSGETEGVANQDVSKTDLSNYVFESIGLSLSMDQDTEVSIDLQKRVYYETLINLGALIHDHKNHIRITHSGDQHAPRINSLVERVKSSKLLSIAHDLYYLRKNEGNVDQSNLCSSEVKSKISLYGSINSEYKLNDIYNKFDIDEFKSYFSEDELKRFSAEFEAYNKEVITIHSTQVFTGGNGVHVKVRDKSGNVKQLIIGSIEDIKNIVNYDYNKETLEIKLKVASDKEYTITCEKRDGEVKYYLSIAGYKTKVGDIIKGFTTQAKGNIRRKLDQLQDKIELLTTKKDIEAMADIEISDQDYIREVRQNLLAQGVSESTFDQFKKQLDYVNEEVFGKYVSDISEELTKNNIEFNRSKFNTAKVKGAKDNKFFSIMAIYDLFDSLKDVPTLGRHDNDALKRIFGINGILDAMNDVRESLGASYIRPNGKVVTKIRPDSAIGKVFRKIPQSARKAFVKLINNPVVESITFATVAYQFGYSIDAIVKGDHHPLNYYFATSNGIKLASMSMKPISMRVGAAVKGLSATTKALRVVSGVSRVLGKLSVATAVVDFAVTIGITIHEAAELVKAIGGKIPLSDVEQAELFLDRILREFSPLYLLIKATENGKTLEESYKDAIKIKDFLGFVLAEGKKILSYSSVVTTVQCLTSVKAGDYNINAARRYLVRRDNDTLNAYLTSIKNLCDVAAVIQCLASKRSNDGLSAVVQYVTSIKEEYSKIIKSDRSTESHNPQCTTESKYTGSSFGEINSNVRNLSSLDISRVLPLIRSTLGGREVYLVSRSAKHLSHITLNEYDDGLRAVTMPSSFREGSLMCGDVINEKVKSNGFLRRCNDNKVYRNCTKAFTFSGEPFIFANIKRSSSSPILYLSGPNQLIAARNYPAVMHIPKGRVNYKGSEYHDNTFIINHDTYGHIRGGTANNTIVMNYSPSAIFVRLDDGIIDVAGSKIELANIHNYISHSTANQNITTGCKTRYVDAGKGGGNNSIQNHDVDCRDEDYEIRKVNKKDTHLRSIKQTIFIVDKSSGSGANISSDNLKLKENLDVISVENADVAQLRINEHQNSYRLDFVACDEKDEVISVKVDSFTKLVIQTKKAGTTKIIKIENKSLLDIIKDMAYQKLNHSGAHINEKIMENSKKRSKAVIIEDVTGSENTTAYAVARGIAESSDNLGITVSQIQVIKGDIVLNYAVNDLSQIKLIPNNGIGDEEQREYNRLLFRAVEREGLGRVKHLLDMGADVEAKQSNTTPLIKAVRSNRSGVIDLLLDRGANINAKGVYNWTAAKWAVNYDRENLVIQLVNRGTDIGYKDNMGHTLLDTARRFGRRRIADFLREKQSEYSRLFVDAVTREDFYEVKDLLNRGADVNVPGDHVGTCLQLLAAMESNKFNKLQVLIDQCASLDIGPMGIVIIKKLRDGILRAPSTEFTNEVCNFHEELFGKMIKKVVSDVYGGADIKKILGFIRGCNNITRNIRGYVAVFDEIVKNNPNNEAMFTLASYVKEVTKMNNYHNVSSEKRSELERIKRGLPKSVKNAVFSSKVCIRNVHYNEYLYAASDHFNYDSDRRRVFTWIPGRKVGQGEWRFEPDGDDCYIKNVYHNEYLYAADYVQYDNDRRRVFTWIPGRKVGQGKWKIEPDGDDCYIKNVYHNEYLYAADYVQYDNDRRRVFTWTPRGKVGQGKWKIEDCGSTRKRRDTLYHSERHQHLKDGKRSSRSPVYVRSIGIHGHHGVTKGIEHDLFYDSVLNNSPQNDETGYNKGGATSGASKQSSWINVFANTIVGAIKDVSHFLSLRAMLPSSSENSSSRSDTEGNSSNRSGTVRNPNIQYTNQFSREVCASNNANLMSFLLKAFLDKKCPLPKFYDIDPVVAISYTSEIIDSFKKVLEKQAESKEGIKMHRLDINFGELFEDVKKKIMGGEFNEISEVLKSHVEKALPSSKAGDPGRLSRKKFDKFMAEFNSRIDSVIDQSMQQMSGRSEVSDVKEQRASLEPKSYLNGISVQGHLTQDRNLRNEGRALIP